MDEEHQSRVTSLMGWGIALMVLGLGGFVMSLMGATVQRLASHNKDASLYLFCGLAILMFLVGLVLLISGLMTGAGFAFGNDRKMPVQRGGPVYVVACVMTNKAHENVYDLSMYDPEDLRYFVQVKFPNGSAREFQTAYEVLGSLGEGMWGYITYQGKWLNGFERVLVDIQRPTPPRW